MARGRGGLSESLFSKSLGNKIIGEKKREESQAGIFERKGVCGEVCSLGVNNCEMKGEVAGSGRRGSYTVQQDQQSRHQPDGELWTEQCLSESLC